MRSMPEFMESEYFVNDGPRGRMKDDAPDKLKKEFEEYNNVRAYPDDEDYPDFAFPYVTWEGKVIDAGYGSKEAKEVLKKRAEFYGDDEFGVVE